MTMRIITSHEFACSFSIISLFLHFFQVLQKIIFMILADCKSPPSISSSTTTAPLISRTSMTVRSQRVTFSPKEAASLGSKDDAVLRLIEEKSGCSIDDHQTKLRRINKEHVHNNMGFESSKEHCNNSLDIEKLGNEEYSAGTLVLQQADHGENEMEVINKLFSNKAMRKRPARLVIPPESHSGMKFGGGMRGDDQYHQGKRMMNRDFEVKGRDFCLASRRGRREVMEDGYGILTDIMGDPSQAFFGVFDGHGGSAAMEYVAVNLGNNIITSLTQLGSKKDDDDLDQLEKAIREGYLRTDKDFLCQDVSSGVCAATVLSKDGDLYVANVGDCRVVLSRNGVAQALTSDHHVDREDERFRIESSGGFLNCRNGVWRVQGSLAVSRAIGDLHLKEWIISEPEIHKLRLTSDCDFLVIASDGLWGKVTNQEAVDVILRDESSIDSCKKLVDISFSRGNHDDITVMIVDLQNFRPQKGID